MLKINTTVNLPCPICQKGNFIFRKQMVPTLLIPDNAGQVMNLQKMTEKQLIKKFQHNGYIHTCDECGVRATVYDETYPRQLRAEIDVPPEFLEKLAQLQEQAPPVEDAQVLALPGVTGTEENNEKETENKDDSVAESPEG